MMYINTTRRSGDAFLTEKFPVKMSFIIRKNSRTSATICLQKTKTTAARVPRCKSAENISAPSPLLPVKCWNKER